MINVIIGMIVLITGNCYGADNNKIYDDVYEISGTFSELDLHQEVTFFDIRHHVLYKEKEELERKLLAKNEKIDRIKNDNNCMRETIQKLSTESDRERIEHKAYRLKKERELRETLELTRIVEVQEEMERIESEKLNELLRVRAEKSKERTEKYKEKLNEERNKRRHEENLRAKEELLRAEEEALRIAETKQHQELIRLRDQQEKERREKEERDRIERDKTKVQVPLVAKQVGKEGERVVQQTRNELQRFRKRF